MKSDIPGVTYSVFKDGDKYYVSKGDLICDPEHSGWHSLRGEGAPIKAMSGGVVTLSRKDYCGGNYVVVDHQNGKKTLYLHLR